MIKDLLVSFRDNFKEKTRNPFLGTYLLVWLIRNWELIYTLFNFDSNSKLSEKVEFIQNYYSENTFIHNLITNIFWAFVVLILTYLLINISRFIINISEKQLTPWIYKMTDSKSIVLKTEYNRIKNERDDLQNRLDHERESKSKLENRIQKLENEIIELAKTEVKKQDNKKINKKENDLIDILIKKLKDKDMLTDFKKTSVYINKGNYISNDYIPKDYFIELGLITFIENSLDYKSKKYKLTSDGENVFKKVRLE